MFKFRFVLFQVSITLILVSAFVILVLALLMVARMRRSRWCCFSVLRAIESCELPERSSGMARPPPVQRPSSSAGLLRSVGGDTGDTVYLPLAMHMESGHDNQRRAGFTEGDRGTTPDTEPPPAYHDLFPVGYKFSSEKINEEASQGLVLSSLKETAEEGEGGQLDVREPGSSAGSAALPAAIAPAVAESNSDTSRGDTGAEIPRRESSLSP
jgi:hypothetical protein